MQRVSVFLALFLVTGCSPAQQSKKLTPQAQVAAQVAKYKNANPSLDLQRAWTMGDLRFIGVYGISLTTPGVTRGEDQGFIHLVGIKPIIGTTDFIQFPGQSELNEVAFQYATKYNSLPFQKLQASKTTHPTLIRLFNEIEQELQTLERSQAKIDFERNVKKRDFRFINVYETGLEGVSDMAFEELRPYEIQIRMLKGHKDLMTKEQYRRLRRVAIRYVRPYNQMLFKYLKSRAKRKLRSRV